jgi:hypothetical protein
MLQFHLHPNPNPNLVNVYDVKHKCADVPFLWSPVPGRFSLYVACWCQHAGHWRVCVRVQASSHFDLYNLVKNFLLPSKHCCY